MENYTPGSEGDNEGGHEDDRDGYWGPHGKEAMQYWKKMAWQKMKMAQKRAGLYGDEESQAHFWKSVGAAAAVGLVLGILIGKKSSRG